MQHAGSTENLQARVDKETEENLAEIRRQFDIQKEKVVQKLLDRVVLVKPELHRNFKPTNA